MSVVSEPVWAVTPEKVDAVVQRLVDAGRPRKIFLFGSMFAERCTETAILTCSSYPRIASRIRARKACACAARSKKSSCPWILVVREKAFEALKEKIGLIYREVVQHGRLVYEAGRGR